MKLLKYKINFQIFVTANVLLNSLKYTSLFYLTFILSIFFNLFLSIVDKQVNSLCNEIIVSGKIYKCKEKKINEKA